MRWARRIGKLVRMELPLLMKQAYAAKASVSFSLIYSWVQAGSEDHKASVPFPSLLKCPRQKKDQLRPLGGLCPLKPSGDPSFNRANLGEEKHSRRHRDISRRGFSSNIREMAGNPDGKMWNLEKSLVCWGSQF